MQGVAQFGSVLALGARCRRFKSCYPESVDLDKDCWSSSVVEQRIENPCVTSSNLVSDINLDFKKLIINKKFEYRKYRFFQPNFNSRYLL